MSTFENRRVAINPGYSVRKIRKLATKWLAMVLLPVSLCVNADEQNVAALRSAYLFYFSSFIEWPTVTEFAEQHVLLCAYTENEKDQFQLNTIKGKSLGELKLDIRIFQQEKNENKNNRDENQASTKLNECHLLYFNDESNLQINNIPDTTLVITEGQVVDKGDIHLFKKNNKLMFEIDAPGLTSRQFKVSSKLLRLSRKEQN